MFKKLLSATLAVLMVFSLVLPAAATSEENPTIYVTGAQTNNLYNADGKLIYPFDIDIGGVTKAEIAACVAQFLAGCITGNYKEWANDLHEIIAPIFEEVKLDANGEASNGSHPEFHSSTVAVSNKQSGYGMWDYRFWYDWRLSPIETAEELKNYIDRVTEATGKNKVQLAGRCYGANVIQAYITLYKDHAIEHVSDISYFASSVMGIDFMSALFSGDIVLNDQAVSNFVDYYLESNEVIEDPITELLVITLVELFNQAKVLGVGTDLIGKFFNEIKGDLLPVLLMDIVGSWPSYWSMVTPELYTKSIDFIFKNNKEEYAKFIEKTDKYYYEVEVNAEDIILELEDNGINFYMFTKYGFPEFPLYAGSTIQSDSYTSVPRQSFGATSADYGKVLDQKYIDSLTDKKYLSPDFKVDASTALLPERSWFVKNLHHNYFEVLHVIALEAMRYDLTVDNDKYPQYLYHENDIVTPLVGADEDATKAPSNLFTSIIRFFTALFNFIAKLFKGK